MVTAGPGVSHSRFDDRWHGTGCSRARFHRVLDGQTHNVSPEALAPELLEFFTA
jgi:hypothetical protein